MRSRSQIRNWREARIRAGLPVHRSFPLQACAAFRVPLSDLFHKILARSGSHTEVVIPAAQTANGELTRNNIFRIGKSLVQQIVENVRLCQKHATNIIRGRVRCTNRETEPRGARPRRAAFTLV